MQLEVGSIKIRRQGEVMPYTQLMMLLDLVEGKNYDKSVNDSETWIEVFADKPTLIDYDDIGEDYDSLLFTFDSEGRLKDIE